MTGIDILILSIMGISCVMGIVRGVTREILGLLTWGGSAFAAYVTYPMGGEFAQNYIPNPMFADSAAALVLFILFLVIFSIITYNISSVVRASPVSGLDRGLGFAYGITRGAVLICAAEIAVSLFIPRESQSESFANARFVGMVRRGADELLMVFPVQWREMLDQQMNALQANAAKAAVAESTQLLLPVDAQKKQLSLKEQVTKLQDVVEENQKIQSSQQVKGQLQQAQKKEGQLSLKQQRMPLDREKTADELSDLKPMAADIRGSEGTYDSRQKRELDRLIDASD